MQEQSARPLPRLRLKSSRKLLQKLVPLLVAGVWVEGRMGCSIRELLCRQFGVDSDYLDNVIQTVFLDGKPVDDVNNALVEPGSTLALSAAMPGLVGATLRKGGLLAGFRHSISHEGSRNGVSDKENIGRINVKLFNLVTKELGPLLLGRGVILQSSAVRELLMPSGMVPPTVEEIAVDGSWISPEQLSDYLAGDGEWEVQFIFSENGS